MNDSTPIVSASLVQMDKLSRFNPLRDLGAERLVQQMESFRAGRLRDLALTMDAMEERDDSWKTAALKSKSAVARNGWEVLTVDCEDEAQQAAAERQKEALEFFYNNLRATSVLDQDESGGLRLLLRQMMDAHGKGYAVHNLVWQPSGGFYKATAHFCPLWFFENSTGKMRFISTYGGYDGVDMEPGAWLVTKGAGIGLACAVAWMFKHLPLRDWLVYCGRFGMPGIEGVTDAAEGSDEWKKVEAVVAAAAAGVKYVRNRSCEINKVEFGAAGELPQPKLVEAMSRSIVSLWRGGDLSTISAGAGQGQGASLQGKESDVIDSDNCEWLSEVLNMKLDRLVLNYVFGEDVEAMAYIKITGPNKQDVDRDLKIDDFAVKNGHLISRKQFAERYNRPVPEEDDDLLTAPATPNPFGSVPARGDALPTAGADSAETLQQASNELAAILKGPETALNERLQNWLSKSH